MKTKKMLITFSSAFVLGLALASCNTNSSYNQVAYISITSNENVQDKVYNPSEVELTFTMKEYEENGFYNTQVMPSTGNVNILVVPILIPGYETIDINNDGVDDKDEILGNLDTVFFGDTNTNESLKFGSVSSFYKESSFNKLNISGVVADWFDVESELGYTSASEITSDVAHEVMEAAVEKYRSTQSDKLASFDSDKDGFIDGVWCIYSCPNQYNGGPNIDNNFWAYTSWANQDKEGDVNNPIANVFGWASYDFMFEGYTTNNLDSHTFVHETGHFLGLKDYYSTDGNNAYSPLGKVDMMDNNIIDHNSYSKMLLGWTKPYLVYGDANIELKSMQNENALIVLQADNASVDNKFNPFSEYILIELYTNEGLNKIDSYSKYGDVLAPQGKGVRIYHINNSLYTIHIDSQEGIREILPYDGSNMYNGLVTPISNSRGTDMYNVNFGLDIEVNLLDEIRLIEKNGTDTFSNGGYQKLSSYFNDGDVFSISTHEEFFTDGLFDNKETFSYKVGVSYEK